MPERSPAHALCLLAAAAALSACSGRDDVRRYKEATFQAEPPPAPAAPMMGARGGMNGNVPTAGLKLDWDAPAGWSAKPGGTMRIATFAMEGAECSLSAFPGDTGGVAANLRRWLGQLDAEGTREQIDGLIKRATAFKTKAGWEGQTFDLSTALPDGADNGMLAAIIPVEGQSVFVKLTGPVSVLEKQREAFAALCASLRPSASAAANPHAAAPAMPPTMPPAMGGAMGGAMAGSVPTAGLKLAWQKPEGWSEKQGGAMRLATFAAGDAEVSVTAFPGDTGGEEANLRRWLGQLGVTPAAGQLMAISAAASAFKTEAGWEGKLYDLGAALPAGAASGMRAAIIPVSGQTVFVKLSGPPATLAQQAAALESFCRSLKAAE